MIKHRRTYKHAISIQEALERIFGYERQESSLSEVLQLTVEQDERLYTEAGDDPEQKADVAKLKKELAESVRERDFAIELSVELNTAADNLKQGRSHEYLVLSDRDHHGSAPHFTKASLYAWAKGAHGIEIPEWEPTKAESTKPAASQAPVEEPSTQSWNDLTLAFRAHNKLHLSWRNGTSKTIDLDKTALINKRNKTLNTAGAALLGLASFNSIRKKKPPAESGISAKIMSELRSALKSIVQLELDPFYPHNPADGWKARFQVKDRRNATNERLEEKSHHSGIDEDKLSAGKLLVDDLEEYEIRYSDLHGHEQD